MSDAAGKEIKSLLIDFPFDVPTFATVSLRERWERLLTKVDVKEKFNNITVISSDVEKSLADKKEKLFIIFSDWIVDDWTIEKIAEFEWPELKADDVLFFENDNGLLPVVLAGENTPAYLAKWTEWEHSDTIAKFVEYAKQNKGLAVSVKKLDNSFSARIYDKKSSVAAEWDLLKFLQFRPGGLVAKYLNRPFSIRMTRRIIKYKFVTPNFVTIADFFIGLFGLSLFLIPSYWAAVIGAVIMHFNSIVDGVDGEVARLRHQSSKIGANLDSFSDETRLGMVLLYRTVYRNNFLYLCDGQLPFETQKRWDRFLLLVGSEQARKGAFEKADAYVLSEKAFVERQHSFHFHAGYNFQCSGIFPDVLVCPGCGERSSDVYPHLYNKSRVVSLSYFF